MKHILIIFALLMPTLAVAQTSRNPCFLNGQQTTQGIPSCESVSTIKPLPVTPQGAANFATSQVTVAATSTLTAIARPTRVAVTITNLGTVDVFCGPTSGVTLVNGDLIVGVKGSTKTYQSASAIYCIAATGTQAVSVADSY